MAIEDWGWDDRWAAALERVDSSGTLRPARVVSQERDRWLVHADAGTIGARIAGRIAGAQPVTGDWVAIEPGPQPADPVSLRAVLPRRSAIARGAAGGGSEQVLAANVDVVWIVHGLDSPVNARRLERYLAVAWESGAVPEVVLTKADLASPRCGAAIAADSASEADDAVAADRASHADEAIAAVESIAIGVRVHRVSVMDARSIDALRAGLRPGQTVVLLGPSGAGKSTLINALADAALAITGEVRARDRKGRHTTTRRDLFRIPGGALLLDTPGLREIRIPDIDEGLEHTFPEIEELAKGCRFRDCRHEAEPGCAVLAAVEAGALDPARLASYRKLRAEAAAAQRRTDPLARAAAVADFKTAMKTLKRDHPKYRRGD